MNQKEFLRVFRYENGQLFWNVRRDVKKEWNTKYSLKQASKYRKDMYSRVCLFNKKYLTHRVIWIMHNGDIGSDIKIDHINCDHSDSRIENLRIATMGENSCNVLLSSRNTSGTKGICWNKYVGKWKAAIQLHGKRSSKEFYKKEDAILWITKTRKVMHGEFANFGFVEK